MPLRTVAGLFLFLAATQLQGAIFTASAVGCTSRGNSGPAAVEAIVTFTDCTVLDDIDVAYARSGPGGLGASADHLHTCCNTATGASGTASVDTHFMITGPAGLVTISLNLALTGSVGGGVPEETNTRQIRIDAIVASAWDTGIYREHAGPGGIEIERVGSLVIPGDLCATVCVLPTFDVTLVTGTLYPLSLTLQASSGGGAGNNSGWADASHTLYFPLDGPVFNLPDGYSAEIPDMNVAGNRVVRESAPGEVPEPATCALVGGGLLFAVFVRRRR